MIQIRTALGYMGLSLLSFVIAACGRGEVIVHNQGNDAFEAGDLDAALQSYEEIQEMAPERPEPFYNSASVRYRNDEHELAQEDLQQARLTADEDLTRATLFNQGNSFFKTNELDQAVESYKNVLRMDPDDQDAKYNLELALRQQEQGQEPDEEQPEGSGEDSGQQEDGQGQGEASDQPDPGQGEAADQPESSQGETESEDQSQNEPVPGEVQGTQISEEQAERLLDSVGLNTETLQNALQRNFIWLEDVPERDW